MFNKIHTDPLQVSGIEPGITEYGNFVGARKGLDGGIVLYLLLCGYPMPRKVKMSPTVALGIIVQLKKFLQDDTQYWTTLYSGGVEIKAGKAGARICLAYFEVELSKRVGILSYVDRLITNRLTLTIFKS